MIRYALRCDQGHDFDGWFRSSDGYAAERAAGRVGCAICGSTLVEKALMAPSVGESRPEPAPTPAAKRDLCRPRNEIENAIGKLRDHVEANSDYVGMSFAAEARAMHEGRSPERAIHGEARIEDAKKLLADGVPVAPLPFRPRQKAN